MSPHNATAGRLQHNGTLSLTFAQRRNKTVITDCYQLPPLRASRALYLNRDKLAEATVYLMESSGSLIGGDNNSYQIRIDDGAKVCLIPQSATKIYPSFNGLWSSQNIEVSIGAKASLAWKTEAIIPYEMAKFKGKTMIKMEEDASLLWGEILTPGREKHGEVFQYQELKTNFQVWIGDDCVIYDALLFSPSKTELKQVGLLENHSYIGSMWLVAPSLQKINIRDLNERLQQSAHMKVSASLLEGKAVNIRWLASDLVILKQEMTNTWEDLYPYLP